MEEETQKKHMQMQLINQQIKQYQQQLAMIDQQLNDYTITKQALEDIKSVKPDTEILVPISAGIYAKAAIKDVEKLIVNVGSGTAVQKDVDSTRSLIDSQLSELKLLKHQMTAQINGMALEMQKIEKDLTAKKA